MAKESGKNKKKTSKYVKASLRPEITDLKKILKLEDRLDSKNQKNLQNQNQVNTIINRRIKLLDSVGQLSSMFLQDEINYIKSMPTLYDFVVKKLKAELRIHGKIQNAAHNYHEMLLNTIDEVGRGATIHEQVYGLLQQQSGEIEKTIKLHTKGKNVLTDSSTLEKDILKSIRSKASLVTKINNTLASSSKSVESTLRLLDGEIDAMEELQSLFDLRRQAEKDNLADAKDLGPVLNHAIKLAEELGYKVTNEKNWETLAKHVEQVNKAKLIAAREQQRVFKHQDFLLKRIEETASNIGSKFDTMKNLLMFMPGIGQKAAGAMDVYRDATINVVKELGEAMRRGEGITVGLSKAWKKFNVDTAGATLRIGSLQTAMLGLSAAYLAGIVYGLKIAKEVFDSLAKVTSDISQATGLSVRQSYELGKASLGALTSSKNYLSNMEDVAEVQKGLIGDTGRMIPASSETLATLSNMAKMFGISQQEAGQLEARMREMGADEELSKKLQFHTAQLAEAEGIAPGIISRDLIKNSGLVAKVFSGYPEKAALAAIEIRKLGYGLEDAGKVMDHLFAVESSLTAQMEASVGLNRMIDVSKARQLAMDGDLAGMMQEMARQAGSYEQYTRLSVPQRILLAKAMGVEEETLQRSLYIQKFAGKLSKEQMAIIMERKDAFKDLKDLDEGMLKSRVEDIQATEVLNAQWAKLKGQLAKALLPLFESIAGILINVVIPAVTVIGKTVQAFLWPITALFKLFKDGFKGVSDSFKETFGGDGFFGNFAKGIVGIIGLLAALPLTIVVIKAGFSGVVGVLKLLGNGLLRILSIFPKIAAGIKAIGAAAKGLDFSSFKNFKTTLSDSAKKVWQGGKDKLKGLFSRSQAVTPPAPPAPPGTNASGGTGGATGTGSVTQNAANTAQSASQQMGDVTNKKGQPEEFLRSLGRGLSALGRSAQSKLKGVGVLAAAGVTIAGPFAGALLVIKDVDPAVIATFSIGIAALGFALKLAGNMKKDAIKAGAAFMLIGISTLPLALALNLIKDIKPETAMILAGTMIALGAALRLAGDMKKDAIKAGAAFILIGISTLPLALVLHLIKDIKVETVAALAGTMIALGGALRIAGGMKKDAIKAGAAFVLIGLSALPLALALHLIKDIKVETVAALAGTMIALGAALRLAGDMKKDAIKAGAAFILIGISTLPLALALNLIKDVKLETAAVLAGTMVTLGYALKIAGNMKKDAVKAGQAFGLIGLSALPLALALNIMKDVEPRTGIILAGTMVAIGYALKIAGNIKKDALTAAIAFAAVSVGAIGIAFALSLLKDLDPAVMVTFGAVVAGLGFVTATLGKIGLKAILTGALGLAAVGLALLPFAYALTMLQGFDMDSALATITAIGGIALEVGGIGVAMVATLGIGAAAMGAGILALGGIGLALIPLAKSFSYLKSVDFSAVTKFTESLDPLATGLKKLAGANTPAIFILGNTLQSITSSLKDADVNMEKFFKTLELFTPDMFNIVAAGIREIGKALKTLDIKYLESLGLLAGLSFVDVPKTKSAAPVETSIDGIEVTTSSVPVNTIPADKITSIPTIPGSTLESKYVAKPLQPTTSVIQTTLGKSSGVASPNIPGTTIPSATMDVAGGTKTEILLNRILITLEKSLANPTPIIIQYDDGYLKRLSRAIDRAIS